jgi:hypothetical protein
MIDGNDRLHRPRRNIVFGAKIEFFETGAHLEGLSDTLLIEFSSITVTDTPSVCLIERKIYLNNRFRCMELPHRCTEDEAALG